MIVSAGFEAHNYWAGFLLTLASAGTFLHTGLKVPYFIWFGKNNCSEETWKRACDPPKNMQVAMAAAAFLCIFIGCYTPYLYNMLPFPEAAAAYDPYTAAHISETLQILLFTALGFFLLLKSSRPNPPSAWTWTGFTAWAGGCSTGLRASPCSLWIRPWARPGTGRA